MVDVAILGGGLAGLTLALQLKRRRAAIDVVVVDPHQRPAPERTSTVGEALAEVSAHYLREVLDLADHLDADQLPKFGLRFFVGDRWDLAERFEIGPLHPSICEFEHGRFVGLPLRTHQVDRGRLENELAIRCESAGVRLRLGCRAVAVRPDDSGHRVSVAGDEGGSVRARWVVVASGGQRAGLPVEVRPLNHRVHAAWARVNGDLDVGQWSADPRFVERTLPGLRRYSTNHLMGRGYWAWVIPLPTGVTSVGVVADPAVVGSLPQDYEALLRWLRPRDPRLAEALAGTTPVAGDFHAADLAAFRATRCFRGGRVAVVGGAAAAVDVLYSPGADLIAVGNSMLTDIVDRDLGGERIAAHCAVADRIFAGFAEGLADIYRGQYRHFGSPAFVATKVTWDSALYFGFHTLLFRHGVFGDPGVLASAGAELTAVERLQARVQGRLRDGNFVPLVDVSSGFVEWGSIKWLMAAYFGARAQPDESALMAELRRTLSTLEGLARRLGEG